MYGTVVGGVYSNSILILKAINVFNLMLVQYVQTYNVRIMIY